MLVLSSAEAWALVEELALSKVQGRTPVQLAQGSLIPFSPVLPRPARALLVGYPEAQLSRFHWFRYPSSRPRTGAGDVRFPSGHILVFWFASSLIVVKKEHVF